jgi:hypothetical protein
MSEQHGGRRAPADRAGELPQPLEDAVRRLAQPVPPSPSLLLTVMAAVEQRPVPRRSVMDRLLERRVWRVSPLQVGLIAASVALLGVSIGRYSTGGESRPVPATNRTAAVLTSEESASALITIAVEVHSRGVRFVLNVPGGERIALVGDFNGWRADATPLVRDPSTGLWTVDLPIPAGRYNYAFVVDGRWVADPQSPRAPEDDFGRPNSVLVVNRPVPRT